MNEWVVPLVRMGHLPHENESRHTVNESCHIFIWVAMYMRLPPASRSLLPINKNKSCHTCEWVTSHVFLGGVVYEIATRIALVS